MACCKRSVAAVSSIKKNGLKMVRYVGANQTPFTIVGEVTGKQYRVTRSGSYLRTVKENKLGVDQMDAERLLKYSDFELG